MFPLGHELCSAVCRDSDKWREGDGEEEEEEEEGEEGGRMDSSALDLKLQVVFSKRYSSVTFWWVVHSS